MSEPVVKTAEAVKPEVSAEDLAKAAKHLMDVSTKVEALGKDDKGQPKPGCNFHYYNQHVIIPFQKALNDSKQQTKALVAKILALSPEEPLVKKFFKNPVK